MLTMGSARSLGWEMRCGQRDRGNAWLENWQRNGSRLPGGRLLWKEGLWAQMNKWLKSDQILSNKSDGPTVGWLFQGVDVRLRAMRAPGEASGLLGICWKVVFWAHIHAACWWTLGDQTLLSAVSYFSHGRSCAFPSQLLTSNKMRTAQNW